MSKLNRVILYCRAGFEKECAAEIVDKAAKLAIFGFTRTQTDQGYVEFECYHANEAKTLIKKLPFDDLIFARQMFVAMPLLADLPVEDRITPIIQLIKTHIGFMTGDLRVEVADTNEGKSLAGFCKKFTVPLRQALRKAQLLSLTEKYHLPVLHLFFIDNQSCYIGYSYSNNHSPFFMGIPRLKFPSDAPSRSTLKLEEAFHTFIPYKEWNWRLANGLHAVDLGASPGGWTYQLVKHNISVDAVDNGLMDKKLMDSGIVKHYQADGFKYQPTKKEAYWLVCDMVEKPIKVTELISRWLINGWCQEAIFNLKLPMKKRYEEVMNNLAWLTEQLSEHGIKVKIQAKHLFHDREEITVHIQRLKWYH